MATTPSKRSRTANSQTAIHATGGSDPQNTASAVKFTFPTQTTDLGLLDEDGPVVWQFDEELGLPVVASADYYGEMYGMYGEPDHRKVRNGTTTVPKVFTEDAHGGGHPHVDFSRDDVLGFFAPESRIANDFPRLYVGTVNEYKQLAQNRTEIVWGETYQRPTFPPSQQERVREVGITRPGKKPFRATRPAAEGWVRSKKLLSGSPKSTPSASSRQPADDD